MNGPPDPGRRRLLRLGPLAGLAAALIHPVGATASSGARPRLVVIGGGFAGSACALQLRRAIPGADVTLIDPATGYVTCPTSNAVIAGAKAMASIRVARSGLARAGVRHIADRVVGIDGRRRRVQLAGGSRLRFDRVVVAPGIRFLWDRVPGDAEAVAARMPHAWQAGAQTELLAAQLRALPDGGVVAISVPAGLMRCPPAPYERASLIAACLRSAKPRSKILIFDANNRFPRQDQFTAAWQALYPGMIEWIAGPAGGTLERVDVDTMTLYSTAGAQRVDVANIIPPQAPGAIATAAGLAAAHGWCPVVPGSFESTLQPRIHVIGDACIADAMPKSASAAVSQARQCALAIAAALRDAPPPPPQFASVCYSQLAPDLALAIPARFELQGGKIAALPGADPAPPDADTALAAERWYAAIRRDAFAA